MVYADLEPFGPKREDDRAGVIAAMIANVYRDTQKHPGYFTPGDFFDTEPKPPPTVADREMQLRMFAARFNALVKK